MPRASAEERAAARIRAPKKPPEPPASLTADAAELWRRIARGKPSHWFDDGTEPMLALFCELSAHLPSVCARLAQIRSARDFKGVKEVETQLVNLSKALTGLATKLRLSVQFAVDSNARETTNPDAAVLDDPLIGGKAVWGERTVDPGRKGGNKPGKGRAEKKDRD